MINENVAGFPEMTETGCSVSLSAGYRLDKIVVRSMSGLIFFTEFGLKLRSSKLLLVRQLRVRRLKMRGLKTINSTLLLSLQKGEGMKNHS